MRIQRKAPQSCSSKTRPKLIVLLAVSVLVVAIVEVTLVTSVFNPNSSLALHPQNLQVKPPVGLMQKSDIQPRKDTAKTKIVGFADDRYRDVAVHWYNRMTTLGYTEHVVVATDPALADFLKDQSYRYEFAKMMPMSEESSKLKPYPKKLRRYSEYLFARRWMYILEQLKQGTSILLTDVDNVFSRNMPMSEMESSEFDVFHAYETKHPTKIFDQQGFVVCGGMGWFRANERTIKFLEVMVKSCGDYCDDQVVLNQLLSSTLQIKWDKKTDAARTKSDDQRFDGLLEKSITGVSDLTGHKIKIWDRDLAFRGPVDPKPCPANNWVSMPIVDVQYRQGQGRDKIRAFASWDQNCPADESSRS